jgi:hypothetical protein
MNFMTSILEKHLVNPTVISVTTTSGVAARPSTLDGLTVGLLDNGKSKAGLILDSVKRRLENLHSPAGFIHHQKPVASKPMPPEILKDIKSHCHVVVTAVGD